METAEGTSGNATGSAGSDLAGPRCQSIEWYGEGEARTVEVDGVTVEVRMIARKGRKARIAITAPAGATFNSQD